MENQTRNYSLTPTSAEKHFPDELPRFSLSPNRSISPIGEYMLDLEAAKSLCMTQDEDEAAADAELDQLCQPIFVSLRDIDAQITPLKAAKAMETIFEGVFLETPPRSGGRTVIPRKKCDPMDEDSSSDEDFTPLCDSFRVQQQKEEEMSTEDSTAAIVVTRRQRRVTSGSSTSSSSSSMVKQLLVASLTTSTGSTAMTTSTEGSNSISSFCNSFQHRLNLIPGED